MLQYFKYKRQYNKTIQICCRLNKWQTGKMGITTTYQTDDDDDDEVLMHAS